MINRLNDFKVEPDSKVWENVNKRLARKAWMRRIMWGGASAAVVIAGIFLIPSQNNPIEQSSSMLAQNKVEIPAVVENTLSTVATKNTEELQQNVRSENEVSVNSNDVVVAKSSQESRKQSNIIKIDNAPSFAIQSKEEVVSLEDIDFSEELKSMLAELPDAENEVTPEIKASNNTESTDISFWVPNVFSPNGGDGIREFKVVPNQVISDYQIFIYARNGRLVYTSTDIAQSWNGKKDGNLMPQAAYVYVIKYKDAKGYPHTKKGTVTLLR